MSITSFTDSILSELENNEDGSFQIRNLGGYAYLKVYKPGKNGKKVKPEEVFSRLKLFGITDYDRYTVEQIVLTADGQDHKIAKWSGGTPSDAQLELEISEDCMRAYATLIPAKHGGASLSLEDAKLILQNNKIVYGIKEDVLEKLINGQKYYIKTLIAEGKPPVHATNGFIKILFDTSHKPSLEPEAGTGRIDFRNVNIIKSVQKGTVLAEKMEPTAGELGKNVYGMDIPFEVGKPGEWKVGANCSLS
ncbi:MAG: FapA family protein, partial [Leptospiraceae bacterium]|nr:FapA family protein [Leptospiraceae bacterium]